MTSHLSSWVWLSLSQTYFSLCSRYRLSLSGKSKDLQSTSTFSRAGSIVFKECSRLFLKERTAWLQTYCPMMN